MISIRWKAIFLFNTLVLLLSLSACTMAGKPSVGSDLKVGSQKLPSKLLLLPVTVSINEISAGGLIQKDPEWSKEGEAAMKIAVERFFASGVPAEIIDMPELSSQEAEAVHEHVLLYEVVASQAFLAVNMPIMGWGHLAEKFGYTLGSGLHFLKQRTGADAALIVIGSDNISTGGRKAMVAMAALVGVAMPIGSSSLLVGVIDLEDGDILWFQHSFAPGNLDLRQTEDAVSLLTKAMEGYGGK